MNHGLSTRDHGPSTIDQTPGMITVEQRDIGRGHLDEPTVAVSADSRYVAFVTYSQLVQADNDNRSDLYVLDRIRHHVALETIDGDAPVSSVSGHPRISGDGRLLVYESGESIVLKDRTENVSTVLAMGRQPAISTNGRVVVFTSSDSPKAEGVDVNGLRDDVYAIDLADGRVTRISTDLRGVTETTAASVRPTVSADGRYVAFGTRPPAEGGRVSASQIFVRDTVSHTTRLVASGWSPSISADGQFVAFVDVSKRLRQVHLIDLHSGKRVLVSRNLKGDNGNGASINPAISEDGRFVAFQSEASDLAKVEDFNLLWDVFLFDRITGEMSRVSGDGNSGWMEPSGGPAIDAAGTIVAFSSRHPTDAGDKRNDFDLYVASYGRLSAESPARNRAASARTDTRSGLFARAFSR